MKERKLGLAKRLSAFALAFVMVLSLVATVDLSALAAGDVAPTLNPGWTYDGKDYDLILAPGQAVDPNYTVYYTMTDTNKEPSAPSSTSLGDWTINWRDDKQFLATDADDYYVWWCAYDAEEDDFSTEPELAGVVTVDKATAIGVDPTAKTVEWKANAAGTAGAAQDLVNEGVSADSRISEYVYAVTDRTVKDPSSIFDWDTYDNGGAAATDVGKYRVWYQNKLVAGVDEDNYESDDINYVDVEITAKALVVDDDAQTVIYNGPTTEPLDKDKHAVQNLPVYNSAMVPVGATVLYGSKAGEYTNNSLEAVFIDVASDKDYKANKYKIYYSASLDGYDTVTGYTTVVIEPGPDTFATRPTMAGTNNIIATTASTINLIDTTPGLEAEATNAATWDTEVYYAVNKSGKIPSTSSLSGWTKNAAEIKQGEGTWYVFYMVASSKNSSVKASAVEYQVVTVADPADNVQPATVTPPTVNGRIDNASTTDFYRFYNGEKKILLDTLAAATGGQIQYFVTEKDEMPAGNAAWFTLGASQNIPKVDSGKYYVWYRTLAGTVNNVNYAATTPVKVTTTETDDAIIISQSNYLVAAVNSEYTVPTMTGNLEWTGRSQYLVDAGTAKNGMYWMYLTYKYNVATREYEPAALPSTTAPRMSDAGIYQVHAFLIDPSATENYLAFEVPALSNARVVYACDDTLKDMAAQKGYTWSGTINQTIGRYGAEITGIEVVDDLTYTGETQNLVASKGKTDKGRLYYLAVDGEGFIDSIDGTAVHAGEYTVQSLVTDLSESDVSNVVALYNAKLANTPANILTAVQNAVRVKSNVYASDNEGSVTIEQATPTVLGLKAITTEYTGYMQDLAEEGLTDGGRIYYMAYDEDGDEIWDDWTRIVPQAEDMGKYTIAYKVEIPKWETNFEEVEETELAEKAYIAAGLAEVTVAPEGINGYANGQAQALCTAGEAEDGVMVYALGTELMPVSEWSLEIPTATEAGEYHVWYKAQATESEYGDSEQHVTKATLSEQALLYRIFNPATGEHLYTFDANEVEVQTTVGGWTLDGTVSAPTDGTVTVYRLMDLIHGVHIYTTDENEIAELVAAGVAELEGPAFDSIPESDTALTYYRLSSTIAPHHYTADQNEIASLVASGVYTLDGPVWYFPQ